MRRHRSVGGVMKDAPLRWWGVREGGVVVMMLFSVVVVVGNPHGKG